MSESQRVSDDAPLILAVDTTSERGSVALQRGSELLAVLGSWRPGAHSQKLHEDVDLLLRRAGVALEQITLFAVAVGPGSFTGVRVGIASVQGLAHALAKPVIGIGALEALAYSAGVSGTICACRDALRGDLYAQLFRLAPDGTLNALSEPRLVRPDTLVASLEEDPLVFIGDATASLLRALEEAVRRIGRTLTSLTHAPLQARGWMLLSRPIFLAPAVAALAAGRFPEEAVPEGATLDALYVRPSDAEVRGRSRVDPLPD
ncbi:tRNA threonylcarbamoyladenosine biosynthesis protein TsaB [bacterium HR08]|nr:tRNA threonylcarbamoyladenosine biosynthesis protein TsaB [bacterium HR08]